MSDFALTAADRQSGVWLRLVRHFEQERADLRAGNDSKLLDERETAYKRGRIAQLSELIALGDVPAPE